MPVHKDFHPMLDGMTEQYCDGSTEERARTETAEGYPGKTCRKALSVFYATCNKQGWDYTKPRQAKEGFSWAGDIKPYPGAWLIRGEAIHPVKTFHPFEWPQLRVFLEDELERSAETLVGKPLFLDHWRPLNGRVLGARYEDGALEYVAELNDEDVLQMIRDGQIQHASVQFEWKILENVNGVAPRGINYEHLSLLKDMPPGDPQTTVELWESIIRRLKEAKRLPADLNPKPEKEKIELNNLREAEWDTEYINNLPDSAFAYIEPGGEKDEQGKTTPRSLRHFPYKNAQGNLSPDHVRNALARLGQELGDWATAEAKAEIKRKLCAAAKELKIESEVCGLEEQVELTIEQLKEKITELSSEREKLYTRLDALNSELQAYQDALEAKIKAEVGAPPEVIAVEEELTEAKKKIVELENKIKELREQQGEEPPEGGVPKADRERLIAHFGEEVATKLLELIGEEAYKLLPPRGTKVQEQQDQEPERDEHGCVIGKERWDEESQTCVPIPPAKLEEQQGEEPEKDEHGCIVGKERWDEEQQKCVPIQETEQELQEQQGDDYQEFMAQCMAAGETREQCAAEWKEQHPEETPPSAEAIISSTVTPPPDMVPKKAIEAVLPPDWVVRAWGFGPQRLIQDIKRVLRSPQ